MPRPSMSALQAAVGLTAGLISIVGAAYSAVQIFKPPPQHGEVVAIVREARTERPIADATLEVFTPDQALVTTLNLSGKGQIRHTLREGPYRLRVSHPRFGAEVRRRAMIGTYVLSAGYYDAYYLRAQRVRTLIKRDFEECFAKGIHAMLTPATPSAAFGIGEKGGADPVEMYLNDIFTVTVNMAGLPAIAVPAGLDGQGLPLQGSVEVTDDWALLWTDFRIKLSKADGDMTLVTLTATPGRYTSTQWSSRTDAFFATLDRELLRLELAKGRQRGDS